MNLLEWRHCHIGKRSILTADHDGDLRKIVDRQGNAKGDSLFSFLLDSKPINVRLNITAFIKIFQNASK